MSVLQLAPECLTAKYYAERPWVRSVFQAAQACHPDYREHYFNNALLASAIPTDLIGRIYLILTRSYQGGV